MLLLELQEGLELVWNHLTSANYPQRSHDAAKPNTSSRLWKRVELY